MAAENHAEDAPDPLVHRRDDGGRAVAAVRASCVARFPGGRIPSLDELLAMPAERVASEPSREALKVPLADGRAAFVKVYRFSLLAALVRPFGRSIAEREFDGLSLFASAGVPVAAPIGWAVTRRFGLVRASAVIEEAVPDAVDLIEHTELMGRRALDPADAERGAILDELARLFRTIHGRGVVCGPKGAHIRNVLIARGRAPAGSAPPRLIFIDLPHARRASGRTLRRERCRDLGRLIVRLSDRFGLEGRARFLAAYHDAGSAPEERVALEREIERERSKAADETRLARLSLRVRRIFRRLFGLQGKRRPPRPWPPAPATGPEAERSGTLDEPRD